MPGNDRVKPKKATAKAATTSRASEKKPAAKKPAATSASARRTKKASSKPASENSRLYDAYKNEIISTLIKEFTYSNVMQAPQLQKMVLNIGCADALSDGKALENCISDLTAISGQKPIVNKAKKSIAGFKLREGSAIGVSTIVRGQRMYYLLDRLCNASLPRIRDFRGISRNSFDGRGNYTLGIREQVIFPEIEYTSLERIRSLQVTICTTAKTDREGLRLLELLGMPFTRQ